MSRTRSEALIDVRRALLDKGHRPEQVAALMSELDHDRYNRLVDHGIARHNEHCVTECCTDAPSAVMCALTIVCRMYVRDLHRALTEMQPV